MPEPVKPLSFRAQPYTSNQSPLFCRLGFGDRGDRTQPIERGQQLLSRYFDLSSRCAGMDRQQACEAATRRLRVVSRRAKPLARFLVGFARDFGSRSIVKLWRVGEQRPKALPPFLFRGVHVST